MINRVVHCRRNDKWVCIAVTREEEEQCAFFTGKTMDHCLWRNNKHGYCHSQLAHLEATRA